MIWRSGVVIAVVLIGLVAVLVVRSQQSDGSPTTSTSPPNVAAAQPTATVAASVAVQPTAAPAAPVANDVAASAATPTAVASNATDSSQSVTHTAVSPEKAMELVQKAGLDSSQVLSVDLVTDASGKQYFEIKGAKATDAPIRVDAQTGAVITASATSP
jgi:uncharacterized membrane protein YkoI